MGALSDIVTISITAQTAVAKQLGFGVPLIVGAHARFNEVQRTYNDTDGMLADGFSAYDPEVLAASALCAQNPRPPAFKVGRRALLPTPVCKVTPSAIHSKKYRINLDGVAAEFTTDATATVAEITAGMKTALDALAPSAWVKNTAYALGAKVSKLGHKFVCVTAGTSENSDTPAFTGASKAADITDGSAHWAWVGSVPTVVDATTYLTLTAANAGDWFRVEVDDDPATAGHGGMAAEWTHADPGIATDLAAIKAADADFFGVMLTTCGTAEVKAAATWLETNKRLFVQASPETAIITAALAGATDVAASLKASNEFRSAVIFHNDPGEFADAAWLGAKLWTDAGAEDWKFAQLASVSADLLSATHIANLNAKNANGFTLYGGLAVTFEGKTAGGEFIDVIRGRDWLESDMQAAVFTAMVNAAKSGKTPFTDAGIAAIEGQVRASLQRAEDRLFVEKGSTAVTAPKASEVATADRAARKLTGLRFSGRLAGAVHAVDIKGVVTV